jgi:hypothetical protein
MEFNDSLAMNVSSGSMPSNTTYPLCPGLAEFSTGYKRVSIAPHVHIFVHAK